MSSQVPSGKEVPEISPAEVRNMEKDVLLLDVRTPMEYEEAHIAGAVSHPLGNLDPAHVKQLGEGKSRCVVICQSGGRAQQAAQKLLAAGYECVTVMRGGVEAWEAEGLPLLRGRRGISLERQVRIGAGILVLTGVILGTWWNPWFYALSAFVGCGLIFAGVTGWCGMALLLAFMPWNKRKSCCSAGN